MHFWYKSLTYLFYPFAPIYLLFRKIRKKEDALGYREKLAKINLPREEGFLVWFHVASVGEAMSIIRLIDDCINEKKINKILITSITLSSGNVLKKRFKQNQKVTHQFLPLDIDILTKKFLNHWKPNLSIFIDSEIWPNLILNISQKKIPLLLLNARITKKSFDRWKLISKYAMKIFSKFDLCIASNKESGEFLKILGAKNVKNYGNIKFSNINTNSNMKFDEAFLNKIKNKKIWTAASTHENEEILCAKTHLKIKENINNILTIIIPRHVDRINKIKDDLIKLNLKVILSSRLEKINYDTDIILIDSYGDTLKFYNISKCVFVGKSLVKSLINNSGQNPIEPAKLGCKILHGPFIENFKEIYQYLNELDITKEINNAEELGLSLVEEFNQNKAKNYQITEKIENHGQNILNNVTMELKKYI